MKKSLIQKSPGLSHRQLTPLPAVYSGTGSDTSPPFSSQTSCPPLYGGFAFNRNKKIGRAASSKDHTNSRSMLNGLPSINRVDNSPPMAPRVRSSSIQKPDTFKSNLDEISINFEPIAEEMTFTLSPSHTENDYAVKNIDISESVSKHKRSVSTPFQLESINKNSNTVQIAPKPLAIISTLGKTSNQALYSITSSIEKIVNHELSPSNITDTINFNSFQTAVMQCNKDDGILFFNCVMILLDYIQPKDYKTLFIKLFDTIVVVVKSPVFDGVIRQIFPVKLINSLLHLLLTVNDELKEELNRCLLIIHRKLFNMQKEFRKIILHMFTDYIYDIIVITSEVSIKSLLEFASDLYKPSGLRISTDSQEYLDKVLLPLLKKDILQYDEVYGQVIGDYLRRDRKLNTVFLKKLQKYWPKSNHDTEVAFLKLLETVTKNIIDMNFVSEVNFKIIVNILVSIIQDGRSCLADKVNDFVTPEFMKCLKDYPLLISKLALITADTHKIKWDDFATGHLALLRRKVTAPI